MSELDNAAKVLSDRCVSIAECLRSAPPSPVACTDHKNIAEGVATLLECESARIAQEHIVKNRRATFLESEFLKLLFTIFIASAAAILGGKWL